MGFFDFLSDSDSSNESYCPSDERYCGYCSYCVSMTVSDREMMRMGHSQRFTCTRKHKTIAEPYETCCKLFNYKY